jgi:hypothetical protein
VAVLGEDYPGIQISIENFSGIQRTMSGIVDDLPEEGFTNRLVDSYWAKGAAVVVCR